MAASIPSSYGPRKRTKTFTGCWTCRARKVKCDEARPQCQHCREKKLVCEGYGARLQWLPPDTILSPNKSELRPDLQTEPSPTHSLRRHIPAEPPKSVLAWSEVEDILRLIESVEPGLSYSNGETISLNVQNFGVFGLKNYSTVESPQEGARGGRDGLDDDARQAPVVDPEFTANFPAATFREPLGVSPYSEAAAAWDLCNLQGHQSPLLALEYPGQQSSAASRIVQTRVFDNPQEDSGNLGPSNLASGPKDSQSPQSNSSIRCLELYIIPEEERLLMHHYMHRVVNLFCVIDNAKSPWKTIHLPRVLQCAGELSLAGSTTRIRNALRNALLSISAFYLSNDHQTHACETESKRWANIASRYRYNAIGLLKEVVETDLYSVEKPKYKDFLATMLSMITINVMSGDTSTCSVHLDGAAQLISHMSTRKLKFSRKARTLHRIYLYLRVIYESTAYRTRDRGGSCFPSSMGMSRMRRPEPPIAPQIFMENEYLSSTIPMALNVDLLQDPASEMLAYECIYGIPQSLLMMLQRAIQVIDRVEDERAETGAMCMSKTLARMCDDLERDILDWPLEERLNRCWEANKGTSAKIIYHQTRSFHNALVIFFSQSVRLLGFRYLRQYVETILDSIEAIEQIKTETNILAAPLFWPAFIGATEAFEERHQERFRNWYEKVEVYGIEAVRTGIQVVHEVWRRGPGSNGQSSSSWRSIAHRMGTNLMLT